MSEAEMFRAPVNRSMRVLDRAFFHRDIPISAAEVSDIKNLSRVRQTLLKTQEILNVRQYHPIQSLGEEKDAAKCVLLKPGIVSDGMLRREGYFDLEGQREAARRLMLWPRSKDVES